MSESPVVFRMPLQVRWRDLDAFNHVNNSSFLTYLEEARIRWFESIGKPWVTDESAHLLAAVQVNYRQPIAYPADVVVELRLDKIGTSSMTIGHRIVDSDASTLYCDGHVVVVWIDRASNRPRPLPDEIRDLIAT